MSADIDLHGSHALPEGPVMVGRDDIAHLRHDLAMPELPYVDFSAEHELVRALARWPLLRELHGACSTGTTP